MVSFIKATFLIDIIFSGVKLVKYRSWKKDFINYKTARECSKLQTRMLIIIKSWKWLRLDNFFLSYHSHNVPNSHLKYSHSLEISLKIQSSRKSYHSNLIYYHSNLIYYHFISNLIFHHSNFISYHSNFIFYHLNFIFYHSNFISL